MSTGQHAFNGELYVIDNVILPRFGARCRTADFVYRAGHAFQLVDGQVSMFNRCENAPCTYELPGLYERAGRRISVETVVTYDALPICNPWCAYVSWWWCIPCSGAVAQTILTIGGCAPYQPLCGGSIVVFVTDSGEIRFGAQTFMDSYNNLPLSAGGGLRVVDVSVKAKGFTARDGESFKILCTYDGVSNTTKVYVNDKLRGIADPFVMGQYVFQPFYNVTGNLHEKITVGNSFHMDASNRFNGDVSSIKEIFSSILPPYATKDSALPGIGQFATYGASALFDGAQTVQYFLPWRGRVHEARVYFDNQKYQGIRYPSTCVQSEPSDDG